MNDSLAVVLALPTGARLMPPKLTPGPALNAAWAAIRERHPEVPEATLVTSSPGRYSACGSVSWSSDPVLIVGVERQDQADVNAAADQLLAWLLHMAAHAVAEAGGQVNRSREGRYHDQAFARAAAQLGLPPFVDRSHPWPIDRKVLAEYRPVVTELRKVLRKWEPPLTPVGAAARQSSRNGVAVFCQCTPARRIRVMESTLELGPITCAICQADFAPAAG